MNGKASLLDPVEAATLDIRARFFGELAPPGSVVIVAIDDATIAAAGGYPIDRASLGEIVTHIADAGAAGLAIDLLFLDATSPSSDAHFASALSRLPNVLASAGVFTTETHPGMPIPVASEVLGPLPGFAHGTRTGLVNISSDNGGTPRHVPLLFGTDQGPQPSFALQAAGVFQNTYPTLVPEGVRLGDRVLALDLGWHMPLRYLGDRGTVTTISAQAILNGTVPRGVLTDKMVVLGTTGTGVGDRFASPFDPILPGVEIQATAIANLLDGTLLRRDVAARKVDFAAGVVLAMLGSVAVFVLPLTVGAAVFAGGLIAWLSVVWAAFGQGIWLSIVLPLAGSVPVVVAFVLIRQIVDRRQTKSLDRARQELSRFQSPALAQRIARDPSFLAQPQEQNAAILFVDLAGFTGAAERFGPAQTRDFLKEFHTRIVDVATKHEGVVFDFMGDGAMIAFGLPDPGENDNRNALTAAFALSSEIQHWIRQSTLQGIIQGVRIGVNSGPVVLSRLGHHQQQQIAATGDCVNVASRLMEVGKTHHANIAVSSRVFSDLTFVGLGLAEPDERIRVNIRGRRESLDVALWHLGEP
ncbi:CHASE2 domain-containing protein [Aliisedimentitalea sp. MJ-SS2]|uniref:CHASE2 domain-containing protein n=1 Tax=Aliisedimentitalea sp. MJ-SS2 TaxID=3049795 RepID=UPI003461724C